MFTSTSTVIFMPCGHCMHHKCHQKHTQTSYQCPTCLKALADMSEYYQRVDTELLQHKMPIEYENTYTHVYCNDCEKKSHAKFHFLYHKCGHCLGYNTKVISTVQDLPANALMAPPLVAPPPVSTHSMITRQQSLRNQGISQTSFSSALQSVSGASSSSSDLNFWCHQCQVNSFLISGSSSCRR